jgi:antitoxin (DNA-binding transcriptional repressor) of toxin-antitoxin stability system
MKTTIEVSDDLYRRAKSEAALRGRKLKDLVEEGLRLVLETPGGSRRRDSLAGLMKGARGAVDSGIADLASNPEQRSVGLKVLKNKLSEYVRHAAGGETVLITDRDRVVAELVPPQPGRSPLLADARLAEAVREGWLAPPLLAGSDPPPRRPVMTLRALMQDLQTDREDR